MKFDPWGGTERTWRPPRALKVSSLEEVESTRADFAHAHHCWQVLYADSSHKGLPC